MGGAVKTDRRGFFKFGAGAAVAAPVAMKQVVNDFGGNTPSMPGGYVGRSVAGPSPEYLRSELADAVKEMAAFDKKAKPSCERYLEPICAQRIDSLRSVSAVTKARMMVEERERLERMRQKGWLQQRIDSLKEQLGPIGSLF
jgi:hypothetical protein